MRHRFRDARVCGFVLLVLLLSLGLAACRKAPEGTKPTTYEVKGIVRELLPDGRTVSVEHEEIPGYMMAMTMPFEVKNTNELAGLAPGDEIAFRMVVTETEGWIENVRKTGVAINVLPTRAGIRRVREVEPLEVGDPLPDYPFTNEVGQVVRLTDFKGRALAFTFFFTRCPYPNFCPRMSNNFGAAQKRLKSMANAPTNWHLLMISFDPEFDTPGILKLYSKRYGADPEKWNFLTGAMVEVDAITEQFGMQFSRDESGVSHNVRTVVADAQGRVQRVLVGNEWKVPELVEEIVKAATVAPGTK